IAQAATTLAAVHAQGILHRDLKPENLFVTTDGQLKILDLGLIKRVECDTTALSLHTMQTNVGVLLGTPAYMSPQQCRSGALHAGSDIYSLGGTLYELVCGEPPFIAGGTQAIVLSHLTLRPPRPRTRVSDLPPGAESIILRALAKNPGERWSSMAELAHVL